jgi:hypothetical protein
MRLRAALVVVAALAAAPATAQTANAPVAVPLAPVIVPAAPVAPAPPPAAAAAASSSAPTAGSAPVAIPPASAAAAPAAPAATATPDAPAAPASAAAAAAPEAPDTPPVIANTWLPKNNATLGVLDKVDGSIMQVSIPVGGQASVGDVTIAVQSCLVRPPDQVPDAAIFLSVQTGGGDDNTPLYRGWMVRSMPGATVVGDASEIFRLISCS